MAALLVPEPAETPLRTVEVDGQALAYRRRGDGAAEAVLLLHGLTTHSFLWEPVLAAHGGPGGRDVVAVDLLGCGASAKPIDVSYALPAHAARIARFCAALGLERVHLVGHDVGGGIAQILAVERPALVRSLTLINTVGYDFWPVQPISALRTPIVRQLMMAALDAGALTAVVRRGLYHRELISPALMAQFRAPLATAEGRKAFVHFARCLDNSDLTGIAAALRGISIPTAILWGMADRYLPFAIAARLAAEIPGARLVRIATAGHFVPIDEPALLAEVLREQFDAAR